MDLVYNKELDLLYTMRHHGVRSEVVPMSKSIPMSLERAVALKAKMKANPDLVAVNNLRVHGNHGAWQVAANYTHNDMPKVLRVHCEAEYEQWLSEGFLPCLRCDGSGMGDGGGLLASESECGRCGGTGERS
jgi:hypothetical protein